MNASQIAEFIKTPRAIKAMDLDELKHLADQFPYTQFFSILYLKGLSQTGSLNFEQELQKHSFRIGDRQQLFALINEYSVPIGSNDGAQEENQLTGNENKSIVSTGDIVEHEEQETRAIEKEFVESDKPVETNKEHQEIDNTASSSDPLDKTILEHAVISNYVLEELNEEELSKLEEREQEKNTNEELVQEDLSEAKPVISIDSKQSFTSWIKSNINNDLEDKSDEVAIRALVSDFTTFDPTETLFGEIEKPKKEFFSPVKKAKESLNEQGLPVSETLAKIYALQGNYPKAIDAYQQLSLKYPEKKVFFANLISELEKKINIK